ncbi:MAG: HAD family phosphatase [Pseudomonadota bacterium]
MTHTEYRDLKGLLRLPTDIEALVFDMDGVLIDSVGIDLSLCQDAAKTVLGDGAWLKRSAVIEHFALHPEAFWKELVKDAPKEVARSDLTALVETYNGLRETADFDVIPGAVELANAAKAAGLKLAVASSNDLDIVEAILEGIGLSSLFDAVAGIDDGIAGKPSPDIYVEAASKLGVAVQKCAFIEDSITGLTAGRSARYGYAIAVASGATSLGELEASGLAHVHHSQFARPDILFMDGEPTNKSINTPNDFVSHMVEHIAWRLGSGIDLTWPNTDWAAMGEALGGAVRGLGLERSSAASLGMIDDGAAECLVDLGAAPALEFSGHHSLDMARILDMRVEQVSAGQQLLDLLEGLSRGLRGKIAIRLCTFEDPHHSWEGVYRALGITLNRLRQPA